jgi:DNA-binding GntR family transcriptional regulator
MSNANQTIYAELRRRIMAGRYEPGLQLKEEMLAAEMKASRTPVRKALQRLASEGLLEARANRGVFVAGWTDRDIDEVFDLRCMLEPHAAALAALRATEAQTAELANLNHQMGEMSHSTSPESIAELQRLNNSFHQLILTASSSPRLISITRSLIDWPLIVGTFYFFSEADIDRSIHHHDDIVSAIAAHDAMLARNTMDVHLRRSFLHYQKRRETLGGKFNREVPL